MHVAVCIVGFRNQADIQSVLSALSRATYADFNVTICENGGAAAYQALVQNLPGTPPGGQIVRVYDAGANLGYAGGVNVCMRSNDAAEAWWILNPDTVPHERALEVLMARLAMGDCDAVGGTVYLDSGIVESRGGRWQAWLARAESIGYGEPIHDADLSPEPKVSPDYLSGACMLVDRRFVEIVGPMREDYFLYVEEVEWFLRANAMGLRLAIAPGAMVLHHQGSTTGSVPDIRKRGITPVYLDERNKLLATRDAFPARLPVAALAALALIFLRFGRRAAWRQLGYALSGWVAGLLNRRGPPSWIDTQNVAGASEIRG